MIEKGKIDKIKLKAENFTKILQKRIDRKDPIIKSQKLPKNTRAKKLTRADAEVLLKMFEELLDNLNK